MHSIRAHILGACLGLLLFNSTSCIAAATLEEELSASFGEDFIFGHLTGESDDFRERNLRGLNAHLFVGLPIQLPWFGFSPGFYVEKRFTLHPSAVSLMGNSDSVGNGLFWGAGTSFRFNRLMAQAAFILGGSSEFSTQSNSAIPGAITHQLSLGSPVGIRAALGYRVIGAIYLHATYSFSTYSTLEYPQSTDPLNPKLIEKKIAPSIQEQAIGIGLSAVY